MTPPERITDDAGHAWPITGNWCSVCGMPLHPVVAEAGQHINCEEGETK